MKDIERLSRRYTLLSFLNVYGIYVLIAVSSILFAKYGFVPQIPGISIDIQFLIDGFVIVSAGMMILNFTDYKNIILSCISLVVFVVSLVALAGLLLTTALNYHSVVVFVIFFLLVMGFDIVIVAINGVECNLTANVWLIILLCLISGTVTVCYFMLHVGICYMGLCVLCELLSIIHLHEYVSKVYNEIYQDLSNSSLKLSIVICIVLEEIPTLWVELIWLPFMSIPMIKERFG
ncbi:hypothetical protein ACLHIM_03415 [Ligilactobacillus sp. LYQ112]|uniref:hypothetical protein n=1 Tax=Ligilactobacillus sp. LYQ112 TaxID=3391060 RepID=UPI003983BD0D